MTLGSKPINISGEFSDDHIQLIFQNDETPQHYKYNINPNTELS